MVSKRKKECGFICFDAPKVPRGRRSVRRRSSCKKTFNDDQLCAFELLAAVAGKLLQESDSSTASSNAAVVANNHNISGQVCKEEPQHHVNEAVCSDHDDQGSSEQSGVSSSVCLQKCIQSDSDKEVAVDPSNGAMIEQISGVSHYSTKVGFVVKPIIIHRNINESNKSFSETDGGSPKCGESFGPNVDSGRDRGGSCEDVNRGTGEVLGIADKCSSKNLVESCGQLSLPINSVDKADLVPLRGSVHDASVSKHKNDVVVDGRDDDDNLSHLSDLCSQKKAYRLQKNDVNSQITKLLTSKKWKSAPKLKDYKLGSKRNSMYPNEKSSCDRDRVNHNAAIKKRRLFDKSTIITHGAGISAGSISSDKGNFLTKPHAGIKISPLSNECQQSLDSANSHVKLSINSFIVPELLLEVPKSTTIGSLKETVMDAIIAVLGGGLDIGILLHGKKIHDDNTTLSQAGISENDNFDDLGFILEPCSSTQLPPNEELSLPTCQSPIVNGNRSLNATQDVSDTPDKTPVTESGTICQALVPFSAPKLENKPFLDSKAIVPVPENAASLAVVPINSKARCSENGQRRIRRPFSVSEVEALVQAVEKLGTGRWRDVKLCAFENAKHRTYVDLKDKWKTLVHTARISPQQRRGEPVPQALLDRVLAAHSRWCHHQGKLQPLPLKVAAA